MIAEKFSTTGENGEDVACDENPFNQFLNKLRIMNKSFVMMFGVTTIFAWLSIISFGANIFETFIIYPNIFHDVPSSLERAMDFMVIAGPDDFFPIIGFLTLVSGIATLILTRKIKQSKYWIMGSLLVIFVGEFLFSSAYFWPKNTVMFLEGTSVHSISVLQETAKDFQTGHWLRLSMNGVAAIMSFIGMMYIFRYIS